MNIVEYTQMRDMIPTHRYNKRQQAVEVCRQLGIVGAFNVVDSDPALKNNPYHNMYHTCCMVVNTSEAVDWYNKGKSLDAAVISQQEKAELVAACLYHDFGHSAGKFNDAANVALAVTAARAADEEGKFFYASTHNGFSLDIQTICNIIAVTEYPFIREPKTLCEKIIRDCDLLQMLEPDWMDMIFVGLLEELKNKPDLASLTAEQFVPLQVKFLETAQFYTEWFEKAKRKQWNAAIKTLKKDLK